MAKGESLAALLKLITGAKTKSAAKSAASSARNTVRKNDKMTGEKEQEAIDRINSKLQAKLDSITEAASGTKKAPPQGVAGERAKTRAREEAARTVQQKGSVAKKMTVSATDIKQAKTANQLDTMQRRIDEMPDGLRKKMMQNMLDRQRASFEGMQAAELDKAGRKAAQSASDRKPFKGYTPKSPFNQGGLAKPKANQTGLKKLPTAVRNKMGYMKRGGVVKSGHMDMRKGGMFYK